MILRLPRMAPHLFRHLGALARVGANDAALAVTHYGAAAAKLAAAGLAGFFALLMACAWLLAAVWDTEWRVPTAGVLTGAFALTALVFALQGRRGLAAVQLFAATRRNVEADRRLYAELRPEESGEPAVPPEVQLDRSRAEIRRIATKPSVLSNIVGAHVDPNGPVPGSGPLTRAGFPRSRTMQMLTRSRGGLH